MAAKPGRDVTDRERMDFARDGAVLLKGMLPEDWTDRLARGLDHVIAHQGAMTHDLGGNLRTDQFPSLMSEDLQAMVDESPLAEVAGRILGCAVRFYMDQLFYKDRGEVPPTPWHQDTCYYNVEGDQLIRTWVSPDPVPENISLEVVKGSHLWNVTYRSLAGRDPEIDDEARRIQDEADVEAPMLGPESYQGWSYFQGIRDVSAPPVPDIEGHRDSYEILRWNYEPGDVLVFHAHVLHGASGGVVSPDQRRAHALVWAGEDVRYIHRKGQIIPDPEPLYALRPRTGQRLSEFPEVFPVAWAPD